MKRQIIAGMIALLLVSVMFFPLHISYAEDSDTASLSAILYDTSQYGSGTGTELTTSGATVTAWQYDTSKFLQIIPNVPDDGNIYSITVKMPKEFYAVTSSVTAPVGYSDATFTKNAAMTATNYNTNATYNLNNYSGTFKYTLESGKTSGTIQMEIQYDRLLWDKLASSSLTSNGVSPLEVILTNETTGDVVKTLSISSATSGTAFPIGNLYNYSTINGTTYSDTSLNLLVSNNVTYSSGMITTSQVAETFFYDKLQYVIQLPKYTLNGTDYYPTVSECKGNAHFTPIVDDSSIATGEITLTYNNVYYATNNQLYYLTLTFPSELLSTSNSSFTFSGGTQSILVSDKNGNMKALNSNRPFPSLNYKLQAEENVTLGIVNKSVTTTSRPDGAVSALGGFTLRNAGAGDSEAKTFHITYDVGNTNYIKVTTVRIHNDVSTQTIPIKYTLVDDDGNEVCIDDVCSWTYNMNNSYYNKKKATNQSAYLYRSMLPAEHRNYYFKTLEYTLNSLPAETYMYASGGSANYSSAGVFSGYANASAPNNSKVNSTMTITSASSNIASITKTAVTTITSSNTVAFGINNVSLNKNSIYAGGSVIANGRIEVSSYPYGTAGWLKDIVIGVVLPSGITINEQSVSAHLNNSSVSIIPDSITTSNTSDGNVLWRIYFPSDVSIGYSKEVIGALNSGIYLYFTMQLDTAFDMNQQTVNLIDSLFATSKYQTNAASGGWGWAKKTDTYDINENGSKTDAIGGLNTNATGVTFEVSPQKATFDITDSVDILKNGISIDSGKDTTIHSSSEIINYKLQLDCTNGGTVEHFSYYIPIPKKNYVPDTYLITSTTDFFDTSLSNNVTMTGSQIYDIYYTLDNVNYTDKDSESITWYSQSEFANNNFDYTDVTMIKLLPNVSLIPNGSSTIISVPLVYDGENYAHDAGKNISFSGAGYFLFLLNGRESSGNFSTEGVSVNIEYEKVLDDFTFMVTKDDNIAVKSYEIDDIPLFAMSQNYKITGVEVSGFTLRSRDYMTTNDEMEPVLANTNFALTLSLNNGSEYEILDSINETPISIGSISAEGISNLKFKIYNASTIGALYLDTRELTVTITGDNGVTIKQKMIINSTPSSASSPELSIITGKSYNTFDDKNSSVMISKDSAFTAQFVVNYVPMNYGNKNFVFSSNLPVGTTITMLDMVDGGNPNYYYYKVSSAISSIPLTSFTKMGTNNQYEYLTGSSEKEEIMLLVVDFSKCSSYLNSSSYNVYLTFEGNSIVDDFESSKLTYVIKDKRTFSVSTASEASFDENVTINYSAVSSAGTESNYIGRKLSFVLKAPNTIPKDVYIEFGGSKYYLNDDNEFILPFIDVLSTSGSLTFKMKSSLLPKTASEYVFNGSLWISSSTNAELPKAGEKINDFTITFKNKGVILPSVKVLSMATRLIYSNEINKNNTLTYSFESESSVVTTIELQQKVGSAYQKVTNLLSRVNGNTQSDMGVYTITSTEGENIVNFNLSSSATIGTYRFVIRVKDTNNNELITIPYNFVIIDE